MKKIELTPLEVVIKFQKALEKAEDDHTTGFRHQDEKLLKALDDLWGVVNDILGIK